jgi:hypothetical protein
MADDDERDRVPPDEAPEALRQEVELEELSDADLRARWLELEQRQIELELERRSRRCVRCGVHVESDGHPTAGRRWCCVPCWRHYAS